MQLPAAAGAAGGSQRRPAVLQPKAVRQRLSAARQQRSSKQAVKARPVAKRSHQRRTLPPLPPPSHNVVAARTENVQHSRPAAASGAGQPEPARPCTSDQAWPQNLEAAVDHQMWQQPRTQPLPPSLWEAMAALQYGGVAQPQWPQQLQEQKQRQQQQHWLLVPPPTQPPPHATAGWYDSRSAEPRMPALAPQDIPAYRPTAQHAWPQLQPPAPRPWQGEMYRPQPVSAAAGPSSWGDRVAAAVHSQQQQQRGATSPAPLPWPHRPAPVHSTAISVAPPSMQMVLQPAAAAERQQQQQQQQPVGTGRLWQAAAMTSAAMGQAGDGCWAPWRPAVSQQP